uniref:CCHC-type domain-containing protein n=1 Tax=Oncorhynchus kisutch TaxID=8019 RepID=A0A8C7IVB1_ONCKI
MAQSTSGPSVPGIGLANTVRFSWRGKEMEPWGRETFGRNILMGHLKLKVKDVLCLQGNPMEKGFDVTLYLEEKHNEIMKTVTEGKEEGPLCHYTVTSLARNNFRVVTVTIYNPHVKDEEVRAFLGRYMDNVSSARYLRDSLGFWNGKRGFQALLRESPKSVDGYLHPPAMFSLGADRGTPYYARQPPFCRRCTLASCINKKCGSEEHEARECDEPKACHGCGSREHLWRDCPDRHRSYASAAGGGAGDGGRKERTRADCTDGTGEKKAREEDGKKEEMRRKMGGKEWGDSLPGFLEVEMRDLVEGLAGMGRCVSPLPPSPKKKGMKRGSLAGSEREGGVEGEGGLREWRGGSGG